MINIEARLREAVLHHQAGRLADAERCYRQLLAINPDHPDALQLLGVIAHHVGKNESARELISRAIQLRPHIAEYHSNFGQVLDRLGRVNDAVCAYERALQLRPNYPEAHNNLGNALAKIGQRREAVACFQQAIRHNPRYAEAHSNLGNVLLELGQISEAIAIHRTAVNLAPRVPRFHLNLAAALHRSGELATAIASYRTAIELDSTLVQAHSGLGIALHTAGQTDEGLAQLQAAAALNPADAEARYNFGLILKDCGRLKESAASFRTALAIRPHYIDALNNLSIVVRALGMVDEAIALCGQGLELQPLNPDLHNSLANALKDAGDVAGALAHYAHAIANAPGKSTAYQNRLLALHYVSGDQPEFLREEHGAWAAQFAASLRHQIPIHANVCDPERRLRIGYVSSDFRHHSVARFILPLFQAYDRAAFEVYCYSGARQPDATTTAIRSLVTGWRSVHALSDDELAAVITADAIDILVDLAGHTAGNRLLVFARKPAPVQISWLGYPNTTGLDTMDYRLTDAMADPPDVTDRYHTEKLLRLSGPAWCFSPAKTSVQSEVIRAGQPITFGSFSHPAKISHQTLQLWGQVMAAVPKSRLMIKSPVSVGSATRHRVAESLREEGIETDRIIFRPAESDYASHLGTYNEVDIALDTFPYHGTTTTCEALWMGRPVISLIGPAHVCRVGLSLLSSVGLAALAATTNADYVRIAGELARDVSHLAAMQSALREQMQHSPLMDSRRFATEIEATYCSMWQAWCRDRGELRL